MTDTAIIDAFLERADPDQRAAITHPLGGGPVILVAGAGSGKCLARGTKILRHDGSLVSVENIKVGDRLMGPDSTPRRVVSLARGRDQMYRIYPTKGAPWGCNAAHILVLVPSGVEEQRRYGVDREISVTDYLTTPNRFKKCAKLVRVGVEFPEQPIPLDPYFLGVWLGDGQANLAAVIISKPDDEIRDYLISYAASFKGAGLRVTNREKRSGFCPTWAITTGNSLGQRVKGRNPILNALRELGLERGRCIPQCYKVNSRSNRLALLAGLVDTDGYISRSSLQIVAKSPVLAEDIVFLCRSLGLAAYTTLVTKTNTTTGISGEFHSISISGDLSAIPTRIPRKRTHPRQQIKDVLRTGFTVESRGMGDYYGFTLEGDGRFLLGDFTVTHNTFVMTARVAWLIANGIPPRRLLAVTFTNKAADELRKRIGVTEDDADCPRISTIHSLALSAIRKDPTGYGLGRRVSPLDDYDAVDMIDTLVQAKFTGAKKDSPWADFDKWEFLKKLHYHRARGLGFAVEYTEEVHQAALKYQLGGIALATGEVDLWAEFEKTKKKANSVDFDDMIHLVVRRGRTDPTDWAPKLGRQFAHVLVDESQDTAPIQWEFLELVVGLEKDDLYCVGDVSQSIMSFQGANPAILVDMAAQWRGRVPTVYKLGRNYRSVPGIVKLANQIQSHMTDTIPLVMSSQREDQGQCMSMIQGDSPSAIAHNIAERIARGARSDENPLLFRDNCILVRTKGQIKDLEPALIAKRIPYVVRGGTGLFQTAEARDLVSYLRIISNPLDLGAFTRAVATPVRGVGPAAMRALQVQATKGHDGDLVRAAVASPNPKLNEFGCLVTSFQREIAAGQRGASEILDTLINCIGYKALVKARALKADQDAEDKVNLVDRVVEAITSLEEGIPGATLEDLVFRLTMEKEEELGEGGVDRGGAAVISTIHSAKGLEWKRVFVTNLYERSLPHWLSMKSDSEIAEERRIFYVAVTRARDLLHLCIPRQIQWGKSMQATEPSRFIVEVQPRRSEA